MKRDGYYCRSCYLNSVSYYHKSEDKTKDEYECMNCGLLYFRDIGIDPGGNPIPDRQLTLKRGELERKTKNAKK